MVYLHLDLDLNLPLTPALVRYGRIWIYWIYKYLHGLSFAFITGWRHALRSGRPFVTLVICRYCLHLPSPLSHPRRMRPQCACHSPRCPKPQACLSLNALNPQCACPSPRCPYIGPADAGKQKRFSHFATMHACVPSKLEQVAVPPHDAQPSLMARLLNSVGLGEDADGSLHLHVHGLGQGVDFLCARACMTGGT